MSVSELKHYVLKSKYARHNDGAKRRESYDEAVNRVREMMHVKYPIPEVTPIIDWAYDEVLKEMALGSQRAMQYGGDPMLRKNARGFNCTASYADRLRFFQETFWLLLCGCGVGFSVQRHHVACLPEFAGSEVARVGNPFSMVDAVDCRTFVVPDTIEGWSDSLGVLLSSYFPGGPFPEYFGKHVEFDFGLIRPKGSRLSSGAGKAPGHESLMRSLSHVRGLLDACIRRGQTRLRPIDAYDIVMHVSEAVLAGGVRRSAAICIFSPDDDEMANAKTGDWLQRNPQRGRSNNSALLLRSSTSFESFDSLVQRARFFGEPGVLWGDSTELVFNPCQPAWAKVRTPDGIRTIGEIREGDRIWSRDGWTKVTRKWSTGTNSVYRYGTTASVFYGTTSHRVLSGGVKEEVGEADSIDILPGPDGVSADIADIQSVVDGLVLGNGSVHEASDNIVHLYIGHCDQDYFDDPVKYYIGKDLPGISPFAYEIETGILPEELPVAYDRRVPIRFLRSGEDAARGFLRGIFSANGSICGDRVTLKSASFGMIEDVQLMLSSIGIRSYYTTNREGTIAFENGDCESRQTYDLNITVDREKFFAKVGFIQKYKMERLRALIDQPRRAKVPKLTYDIVSVELVSVEETFDMTVDNASHTYWTQGCDVSNCAEASFYPRLVVNAADVGLDGMLSGYQGPVGYDSSDMMLSGFQMCNLSSVNGNGVETPADFYHRCIVASVLGTLQAGFTDFDYLGRVTEEIVRKEALLGVSITSIMSNPKVMLDPAVLRMGAQMVLYANANVASIIGINPAARATLMKPEGTGTLMLGSLASGCHGWPFRKGIRHVQANRDEVVYQWFREFNPDACQPSTWARDGTDDVIAFPVEAPPGAKLQEDMTAVEFLDVVKTLYLNWVVPGKRPERCTQPWLNHSVSNTVKVKDHEWDGVTRHIYDNRSCYAGVSLLSWTGDKDYEQAPNVAVYSREEMEAMYGKQPVRLVTCTFERVMLAYGDDLWQACRDLESGAIPQDPDRAMAYGVADWFCVNHMGGDRRKMCYLLKDVYYADRYERLKRSFVPVPYEDLIEEDDATTPDAESSCAGGACALV